MSEAVRIFINGRFLTQHVTGVQRYALELVRALDKLIARGEIDTSRFSFELVAPASNSNDPRFANIPMHTAGRLSGHLWEQLELPSITRGAMLVNLCNTGPIFKRRQTVTIHDAAVYAVPQAFSFAFRAWYKVLLPILGRVARRIITVSDFSRNEITRELGIATHRCVAIHIGREQMYGVESDDSVLQKHGIGGRPFVLAVSSMSPHKNFAGLVRAVEMMQDADFDVVIAGGANPRVFSTGSESLPAFVRHVGFVTDGELRALYEHAACFVYPSLYEGFGVPPLEAMTCGCPVIVSNVASMPEVCGDAARYCDPSDPESISGEIRALIRDAELRADLRKRGLARARRYSWESCARETWATIAEVCAP